ncbi:MAG: phosphatase PAP2-related protein [Cyclobacteriaceae bacterium]
MSDQPTWNSAIHNKNFVVQLVFTIVALLSILLYLPHYFHSVIGPRPGRQLHDPILNLFTPQDFSVLIFALIYLSLAIVLWGLVKKPYLIALGLGSYLIITIARMITMYLFTLEPPNGIIVLQDPFIDRLAYGGNVFTKDLFFSGHVATLTLLGLVEERPWAKKIVLGGTVIVGFLIILQRVHYTIDVVAAPVIAYGITKLVNQFQKRAIQPDLQ